MKDRRRRPDPRALAARKAVAVQQARSRKDPARGEGQGTPSYTGRPKLPLTEVAVPAKVRQLMNATNSVVRAYRIGDCSAIVTREYTRWHLSVAHPLRYPHWDEIAEARYRLIPDGVTMALLLPPRGEYVNLHRNCFQLIEVATDENGSPFTPAPDGPAPEGDTPRYL